MIANVISAEFSIFYLKKSYSTKNDCCVVTKCPYGNYIAIISSIFSSISEPFASEILENIEDMDGDVYCNNVFIETKSRLISYFTFHRQDRSAEVYTLTLYRSTRSSTISCLYNTLIPFPHTNDLTLSGGCW